tara:strand:- start:1612 stop:2292 length:681 start_codon:yes stop_codon:yes gene_type:complete
MGVLKKWLDKTSDKVFDFVKKEDKGFSLSPENQTLMDLRGQEAHIDSRQSRSVRDSIGKSVANVDVYSDFVNVDYPKAGTSLSTFTSEVIGKDEGGGYLSYTEGAHEDIHKGGVAEGFGKKAIAEFTVSGMSPDVGDFSYDVWSEDDEEGNTKYFYGGLDKDKKRFEHEFDEETYNLWAGNLKERSERLYDATEEDMSSVENIRKMVKGKANVSVGTPYYDPPQDI